MSPPRSDDDLDALLARGRVSGAQREAIVAQVLKRTAAPRVSWLRRSSLVLGGVLSAAALLALARGASLRSDGFHAKGTNAPAGAHVSVLCKDGTLAACPHTSKLLFMAGGVKGRLFLNAYAENTATGERVWFSPGAQDQPAAVAVAVEEALLDSGVPLGSLPAGSYRLHMSLSQEPLSRAGVLGAEPRSLSESTTPLTVLP